MWQWAQNAQARPRGRRQNPLFYHQDAGCAEVSRWGTVILRCRRGRRNSSAGSASWKFDDGVGFLNNLTGDKTLRWRNWKGKLPHLDNAAWKERQTQMRSMKIPAGYVNDSSMAGP